MKKVFERIDQWLKTRQRRQAEAKQARRECALLIEARKRIQVREFGGALYLTYDGNPVALASDMKQAVADVLDNARAAWVEWRMEDKV